jgi:hypothetical protein
MTTWRSLASIFGVTCSERMRSLSKSMTVSNASAMKSSWYTVKSFEVYALLVPPLASSVRSNCPGPYFFAPLNIMCSKRWLMPVMPGRSLREPTLKNV